VGAGAPGSAFAVASATLLLAVALVTGLVTPVFVALLLLGAIYVIPEGDRAIPAPIYAGTLLLAAELAFWSLDERESGHLEPGTVTPRLRGVLAVVAIGVAAGALVLFASEADTARSTEGTAAGLAAILACLAVLTALARSDVP
jgi:peptidoglycan/LPS O-acetylase OafA/YrhL